LGRGDAGRPNGCGRIGFGEVEKERPRSCRQATENESRLSLRCASALCPDSPHGRPRRSPSAAEAALVETRGGTAEAVPFPNPRVVNIPKAGTWKMKAGNQDVEAKELEARSWLIERF